MIQKLLFVNKSLFNFSCALFTFERSAVLNPIKNERPFSQPENIRKIPFTPIAALSSHYIMRAV